MLSGDMSDNNKVRAYEDGKVTNLTIVGLPAISSPSIMSTTSSTRSLAQWNIAIYEGKTLSFVPFSTPPINHFLTITMFGHFKNR